jgi:hypothetical protein
MAQSTVAHVGGRLGVFSWTDGFKPARLPQSVSETDVLSRCMWLERHGRDDEADLLLQQYCR